MKSFREFEASTRIERLHYQFFSYFIILHYMSALIHCLVLFTLLFQVHHKLIYLASSFCFFSLSVHLINILDFRERKGEEEKC